MAPTLETFIADLSGRGRILLLGGLAVIAHGLSRSTKDADIWLEPFGDPSRWGSCLVDALAGWDGARFYDLRAHGLADAVEVPSIVERDGVIRITGFDRPLDVFRHPHNLELADFDDIWVRASPLSGGVRLPEDIDLLVTKEHTSRDQDAADVAFLESRIRTRLARALATCSLHEATNIFQRYLDHEICRAALGNPLADVKNLARAMLEGLAHEGDPFASEILKTNEENPGDVSRAVPPGS